MTTNKKGICIGVSEFSKVISSSGYYVDKTHLIEGILDSLNQVILFTRPRRFGKTLNMTMLRDFCDISKDTRELFSGLYIEDSIIIKEINSFPVLYFTFKDCKGNKPMMISKIRRVLREAFLEYKNAIVENEACDSLKDEFMSIYGELTNLDSDDLVVASEAIRFLSSAVSKHYDKKVMIIMDEYDTPMNSAYYEGCFDEMKDFFTALYGTALKDNPCLEKAVLTGIQRISKESIFSGLNNLEVNGVCDEAFSDCFGLTSEETSDMLEYYGLELNKEVKSMYNGYLFGKCEIYNPWSVINYAQKGRLEPFWVNTAGTDLLKSVLENSSDSFKEDFEHLIQDEEVETIVNQNASFNGSPSAQAIWGLFLNAGYVTARSNDISKLKTLRIPNEEVKEDFLEIVADYTKIESSMLLTMFYRLIDKRDYNGFVEMYRKIIRSVMSVYDAHRENAYHMLMLGMCVALQSDYEISSNIEAGDGRPDIVLKSKDNKKHPSVVIELKHKPSLVGSTSAEIASELKVLANQALSQIKEKDYAHGLSGEVILMGVAHHKKHCEAVWETL